MGKIFGLIVAAGRGSRFGGDIPKQYHKIGDKTVLEHSVARLNLPMITDLTVVVAKDDAYARQLNLPFDRTVYFADGGDERWQSVWAGVQAIRERGADDNDWVLIHDAARPCLPSDDLIALCQSDEKYGAILATPVVDTLKKVNNQQIEQTVDRSQLWQALTPQMFRLKALEQVLIKVHQDGLMITDEASAFELAGLPIGIVPASRSNMKLTHADDLPIIQAILHACF